MERIAANPCSEKNRMADKTEKKRKRNDDDIEDDDANSIKMRRTSGHEDDHDWIREMVLRLASEATATRALPFANKFLGFGDLCVEEERNEETWKTDETWQKGNEGEGDEEEEEEGREEMEPAAAADGIDAAHRRRFPRHADIPSIAKVAYDLKYSCNLFRHHRVRKRRYRKESIAIHRLGAECRRRRISLEKVEKALEDEQWMRIMVLGLADQVIVAEEQRPNVKRLLQKYTTKRKEAEHPGTWREAKRLCQRKQQRRSRDENDNGLVIIGIPSKLKRIVTLVTWLERQNVVVTGIKMTTDGAVVKTESQVNKTELIELQSRPFGFHWLKSVVIVAAVGDEMPPSKHVSLLILLLY
jgi:hypothetical protein